MIKSDALIQHVAKSARWDPSTIDMVDWNSHQRAISNTELPIKFMIIKFIHNILPTGKVVNRYKPYYNSGCSSCDHQCEDQSHLLNCPNVERTKWKSLLNKDLIKFCQNTKVSEELQLLLINGISDYLQDSQVEYPQQYPDSLQVLIQEQQLIGWDQFLMGRISKRWLRIHHQQLKQRKLTITLFNSGIGWSSQLITIIWSHIHSVWIARNLARHGKDQEEQKVKRRQQCIAEIKCYYEYKSSHQLLLSPDMNTMFYPSLHHHLQSEPELHQLQTWLCTYREVIETSRVDHKEASLLVRESCPNSTPTSSPSKSTIPQQVVISQSQEDCSSEEPQHFKNDTIQFEMLHSTQISDAPTLDFPTSQSVCSHSTSTFTPSLVSLRAVNHTKQCWKCPADDLVNK